MAVVQLSWSQIHGGKRTFQLKRGRFNIPLPFYFQDNLVMAVMVAAAEAMAHPEVAGHMEGMGHLKLMEHMEDMVHLDTVREKA